MEAAQIPYNTALPVSNTIRPSRILKPGFQRISTGIICFSTVTLKHIDFSAYTCFHLFVILSYSNFRTKQFTAKIKNGKLSTQFGFRQTNATQHKQRELYPTVICLCS